MPCGNDIVDLQSPEATGKGLDARFVARVLSPEEQRDLSQAGFSDRLLWLYWAAKEASYKLISGDLPSFLPRLFGVHFPHWPGVITTEFPASVLCLRGKVVTPGKTVHVRAQVTRDYVHVQAALTPRDLAAVRAGQARPVSGTDSLSAPEESRLVRRFALTALAASLGLSQDDLTVRDLPGPRGSARPVLYHRDEKISVDLSFSHHGRYIAYAFLAAGLSFSSILPRLGPNPDPLPKGKGTK